jgi:hypothetical protein
LGNEVVWLADKKLNGAFVSSKRNDRLLVPPVVRKLDHGNHVVEGKVRPIHPNTTFGEDVEIIGLTLDMYDRVLVDYQPVTPAGCVFTTRAGSLPSLGNTRSTR